MTNCTFCNMPFADAAAFKEHLMENPDGRQPTHLHPFHLNQLKFNGESWEVIV